MVLAKLGCFIVHININCNLACQLFRLDARRSSKKESQLQTSLLYFVHRHILIGGAWDRVSGYKD